ncbi:Protein sidekick-1 [Holothuria leucospilota]|uniref:Protein sidekick-1 n=1 Tax=Holothuria leucospilota TaxID=206669 RepID=A0A9Q1H8L3_HOLLE|nr:Protein sidekick-1 [Holothuria leucospilota]
MEVFLYSLLLMGVLATGNCDLQSYSRENNTVGERNINETERNLPCSEPGVVRNLEIFPYRPAKLKVTWNAPSRQNNPCNVKSYTLLYKLLKHKACWVNAVDQTHKTFPRVSSGRNLTGLADYADYEVSVYAMVRDGSNSLQGPVTTETASTPSNVPSSAPVVSVDYERSTSRSLFFTWEPVPCEDLNGPFLLYFITSNGTSGQNERITYQNTNTKEVSHLIPCTLYEFTIRVVNDFGEGPIGRAVGKTKKEQPEEIRHLRVYPYAPATLGILWNAPARQNNPCNVKSYTLLYKLVRHKACGEDEVDQSYATVERVYSGRYLTGLADYAVYEVSVYAIVRDGSKSLRGPVTRKRARTPSNAPSSAPVVSIDHERSTSRSLVFTWESVPCKHLNGLFLHYQFTNIGPTGNQTGRIVGKETNTKEIFQLLPCTSYEFALRVVNNIGEGPIGIAVGKTKKEAPGRIRNLRIYADGPASLRVTWTVPSRQNNPCNVNTYNLLYKLVRHKACGADEVDQNNETVSRFSSGSYLTGLEDYADYEVSVYPIVEDGLRSLRGPVTTKTSRTLSNAPSSAPVVSVDNKRSSSRTLVFTWNSVPCESLNGLFRHYQYLLTNNGTLQQNEMIRNPGINTKEISQLLPCTFYHFTLRVVNDFGEGPIGRVVGKTKKEPPGNDFNIRLRSTEPRSISVRWTRPHRHPCTISSQIISIEMIDTGGCINISQSNESTTFSSNVYFHRFNDLIPNTLYKITLRAENSKGYGEVSSQEKRTGETYPPQLPKPESLFLNTSVIRIRWGIPDPPHGIILNYDISVQAVGNLSWSPLKLTTVNTSGSCESPTASVAGLRPNTYYSLQICKVNYNEVFKTTEFFPAIV